MCVSESGSVPIVMPGKMEDDPTFIMRNRPKNVQVRERACKKGAESVHARASKKLIGMVFWQEFVGFCDRIAVGVALSFSDPGMPIIFRCHLNAHACTRAWKPTKYGL
jgi:hypothetical protein